jgi:zinc carboxypeptidase
MSRIAPFVVLAATVLGLSSPPPSALVDLKTTPEATSFKSTSRYDDVVRFMKAVDEASPLVFYTTYGTTPEGRAMPLAVVGRGLKDADAAAVRKSGKLRVHVQGNIHAGEVEGKESALILLRELAQGRHDDWLQSTVFLVTPIYNADGNEKMALDNRGHQNGPINGMGTRANAQGLNLNRDFTKLDTPEARAFVKLWVDYDPQVGIDLHTSNGSNHAYYLTYSPPLNPNTSDRVMAVLKDEWFPFVSRNIKSKHGWDTFYYGNAGFPGARGRGRGGAGGEPPAEPSPPAGPRAWSTFEHVPRFHNNYVGLRNRFALLSEAYSYATFEDRIRATSYFLEEALTVAHRNAARLRKIAETADRERLIGTSQSTRARLKRGGMVEVLMGEVEEERNPNNGAVMNRRKDVVRPEQMIDMMWFEPAATETMPAAYYVPATATRAVDLLRAHGVRIRVLPRPAEGIEQFAIESDTPLQTFEGHRLRRLEGRWQPAPGATAPAGAVEVPMDQPLARLAFYLLEPTSDDGVVNWNLLDEPWPDTRTYPISRKR